MRLTHYTEISFASSILVLIASCRLSLDRKSNGFGGDDSEEDAELEGLIDDGLGSIVIRFKFVERVPRYPWQI